MSEDKSSFEQFHDGDDEDFYGDNSQISIAAHGVTIKINCSSQNSAADLAMLLDKAVESITRLQNQIQ